MKFLKICVAITAFMINTSPTQAEECTLPDQCTGSCMELKKCESAIQLIKRRIKPEVCRFEGINVIVCCPNVKNRNSIVGQKTQQKCEEIKQLKVNQMEDKFKIFVANGTDADVGEFKHMAALGYGEKDEKQWLCGGTLISEKYIITAAHCLQLSQYSAVRWARLGVVNLKKQMKGEEMQDFEIVSRIKHPENKPPLKYNDIALLKIDRPAIISKSVSPACLHVGNDVPRGQLYATGWGLLEYLGEASNHLQEVKLDLFNKTECTKIFPVDRRKLNLGIIDSQVCAGGRLIVKDTCPGDSGGPLQYKNYPNDSDEWEGYRTYTIYGITSFGKTCGIANIPGVYTLLTPYIGWIESIVWPN